MNGMTNDTYQRLIALLDQNGARYRILEHEPEGRTERISSIRGHDPRFAAKAMLLALDLDKQTRIHVLAVVPGNKRVSFSALKHLFQATHAAFASREVAETLAGSRVGAILPLAFDPDLKVVVDVEFGDVEEIYFNAARLDRSIALNAADYLRITKPRMEKICE